MPRSESASSRAHAASTSSVKSGGPSPRNVAIASRISSAFPTACAERLVHVGQQADDLRPARVPSSSIVSASVARVVQRLHERAVADLDVEDDRLGSGGDLLGHDARRDQRDVVDRRRDVAKRVELLVGGDEVRASGR